MRIGIIGLGIMTKDMRLALQRAAELGVAVPHTRHVHELLQQTLQQGLGDLDFSALAARRTPVAP